LGNIIDGEGVGVNQFRTTYGDFAVECSHDHSKEDKVNLLARPFDVPEEANVISGSVSDVIFQHDRYKVSLDNDLYVYLEEKPKIGEHISVSVKMECLG